MTAGDRDVFDPNLHSKQAFWCGQTQQGASMAVTSDQEPQQPQECVAGSGASLSLGLVHRVHTHFGDASLGD